MRVAIHRLSSAIGSEFAGIDRSAPLDNATFAAIRDAFVARSVLVFRGQDLSPDAQLAFSALRGCGLRHG